MKTENYKLHKSPLLCLSFSTSHTHTNWLKFHVDCVDPILRMSNSCPLDGYVVYNPLTFRTSNRKTSTKLASCFSSGRPKPQNTFIPGVGLRDRIAKVTPSHGALHSEVLTGHSVPLNTRQQQTPTLRHCSDERDRAASAESHQTAAREEGNHSGLNNWSSW